MPLSNAASSQLGRRRARKNAGGRILLTVTGSRHVVTSTPVLRLRRPMPSRSIQSGGQGMFGDHVMAMLAMAFPIPAGKTEPWKKFISELTGARKAEFAASRRKVIDSHS